LTSATLRPLRTAPVEQTGEYVTESTGCLSSPTEEVTEIRCTEPAASTGATASTGETETASSSEFAELVVFFSTISVTEDVVCLADRFELVFGFRIRVGVGVKLASELAIGLFDLSAVRRLGDAEDLVEILVQPICLAHERPSFLVVRITL
jgi:hypothetical protein